MGAPCDDVLSWNESLGISWSAGGVERTGVAVDRFVWVWVAFWLRLRQQAGD